MSFDCMRWAMDQKFKSSSEKMLLVAISDSARLHRKYGELPCSFGSISHYMEKACLSRRTVISCLKRLIETGRISDTGHRVGHTNQIPVYALNINSVKSETVAKVKQLQNDNSITISSKGITISSKGSKSDTRKLLEEPIKEPITIKKETKKKVYSGFESCLEQFSPIDDCIPLDILRVFCEMRAAKKGKPFTDNAFKLIVMKLVKMNYNGYSVKAILNKSIIESWSDVYPKPEFLISDNIGITYDAGNKSVVEHKSKPRGRVQGHAETIARAKQQRQC